MSIKELIFFKNILCSHFQKVEEGLFAEPIILLHTLIMPPRLTRDMKPTQPRIWWANAVFFILVHFGALVGMYYFPPWATSKATLLLWFTTWQLSDFGCVIPLL